MLDTDVLIAALDRGDAHHGEAAAAIEGMIKDEVNLLIRRRDGRALGAVRAACSSSTSG